MYLIKWAGLGYEYCTWETREDINSDELIAEFHRLNNGFSDAFDMEESVVSDFLDKTEHVNETNAGGIACVPTLRSQLYAQTRALQFVKFGLEMPEVVGCECGPSVKATSTGSKVQKHPKEVLECVSDLVFRVAHKQRTRTLRSHTSLPPPLAGEYDTIIPVTAKGLMMNVGEVNNSVAFLGYRKNSDGSKGPAELAKLIRNVGDIIIAVDGESTIGKSFKDVIALLRLSGENKFAYMRFLDSQFKASDKELVSVGVKGRYAFEELRKKFSTDRDRVVVKRTQHMTEEVEQAPKSKDDEDDDDDEDADDEDDSEDGSEGEFQPDSDDEELANNADNSASPMKINSPSVKVPPEMSTTQAPSPPPNALSSETGIPGDFEYTGENTILASAETTRSLAIRLIGKDVGYSSDEGGDEESAFFIDGVDETFSNMHELSAIVSQPNDSGKKDEADVTIPARQSEFSSQGDRAKLASAIALTSLPPDLEDLENFPLKSRKAMEAESKLEEAQQNDVSPTKAKRSTVKIEQIDISTGDVVHIWANAEAAAATLQVSLNQLRQVLSGEYDEDVGDEVGGYKWRYALAGAKPTAGVGATSRSTGSKKAKEAWLEFRDKLYDPAEPHIYKNGNRLRDYQVDGVNWLASTWYKRQGAILADEMVR
jgi:hypothetical protein